MAKHLHCLNYYEALTLEKLYRLYLLSLQKKTISFAVEAYHRTRNTYQVTLVMLTLADAAVVVVAAELTKE